MSLRWLLSVSALLSALSAHAQENSSVKSLPVVAVAQPAVATGPSPVPVPGVPAAVAKTPVQEPKLREAASVDGKEESSRIRLNVEEGVTDLVTIARGFMNHIETPFEDPKVITVNQIEFRKEGQSIYIATNSDRPVGIEIRSNDPQDKRSISLALVPKAIPPRTILLQFSGEAATAARPTSAARATRWERSAPYEERLIDLATKTARGEVPEGYSLATSDVEELPCHHNNIDYKTGQRLTGTHFSVFVLKAINTSQQTMELQHNAGCNFPGVLFVAPFPDAYLRPNGQTELYVVVSNDRFQASRSELVRPSLLQR